jgi:hypothetical protein
VFSNKAKLLDIAYLGLAQSNMSNNFESEELCVGSRILDPFGKDYVSQAKAIDRDNLFQNMINQKQETSQDFIVQLCSRKVTIFKLLGLRSYP